MNTEQQIQLLEAKVAALEAFVNLLGFSDRYVFQKNIQVLDGRNIQLAKGTGTKIGTESTQKMGFYGATPVVRQSPGNAPSSAGVTYDQSQVQSIVDAVNSLRTVLQNLGLTT